MGRYRIITIYADPLAPENEADDTCIDVVELDDVTDATLHAEGMTDRFEAEDIEAIAVVYDTTIRTIVYGESQGNSVRPTDPDRS